MTSFIILHYLALEMTVECVESIKKTFDSVDYKIIIVDNASPNGSGAALLARYKYDKDVVVILNHENLGFANGNNVGWKYAKEHFSSDYIIVMNNDVLLDDSSSFEKICRLYEETEFDILGPDIYVRQINRHQNPKRVNGMSLEDVQKMISDYEKILKAFRIYYFYRYIRRIIDKCIQAITHIKPRYRMRNYISMDVLENPVLHGACYIVSKRFIENEDFIFNPDTFMYMEEEILHYYCMKKNYKMIYSSRLTVEHLDDVSTNKVYQDRYSKELMKKKEMLKSAHVLLRLMED